MFDPNACSICGQKGQLFFCYSCKAKFCKEHRTADPLCEKCRKKLEAVKPNRAERRKIKKGLRKVGISDKV